jgi:hypothetical protein
MHSKLIKGLAAVAAAGAVVAVVASRSEVTAAATNAGPAM